MQETKDIETKAWLPSERSGGNTHRSTVVTCLIAALLLAVLNAGGGWLIRASNSSHAVVRAKWALLEQGPEESEPVWLVLGDSSGNQGVDPRVLGEALGAPCYNLCTIGDMLTLDSAWMLDRWIKEHGAPRGVLLVHVYDMWDREPDGSVFGLVPPGAIPANPKPALDVTWEERLTMRGVQFAPLITLDKSFKRVIRYPIRSFKSAFHEHPFGDAGEMSDHGFLRWTRASPSDVRKDISEHIAIITERDGPPGLSDANTRGLDRIGALCKDNAIPLFLANAPTAEALANSSVFLTHFSQTITLVDEALTDAGWGAILFAEPVVFPADVMQNADHLIDSSAEDFTGMLAEEIASRLDAQ